MRAFAILASLVVLGAAAVRAQDTTQTPPAPPPPPPAAASLSVEAALARSVMDRVPQDTGTTFTADVGELVLWTRVSGLQGEGTIRHVWFHGDEQVGDVELRVAGSPWRTWSRKTIPPEWTGAWHVEIRDASGAVLKRIDFTIG